MAGNIVLFIFLTSFWRPYAATNVIGISPSRLPFYDASKDFTCLDGSKIIGFSSVNDDYCDCNDGSDEPGTSACPNGRFFCPNNGYHPVLLPSSRVNDGICDCCDGSDEYSKPGICGDNCLELGMEYREQKKKEKEIFDQGVALREELSQQGKQKKEERLKEMSELQKQADEKKLLAEELKAQKESVEALESEAKEKHDKEWDEIISKLKAEKELERATAAFATLDSDESGRITVEELTAATTLDKQYTEDEAKGLIGGQDSVDKELFVSELWNSTFKEMFNKTKPEEAKLDEKISDSEPPTEISPPPDGKETPEVGAEAEVEDEKDLDSITGTDEHDDDEEEDEEEEIAPPAEDSRSDDDEGLPPKPDYNEETKKLIEDANKARKDFEDASKEKDDLLQKLADIDRLTKVDMGEHEEFSPLQGQCFEFSDREYTYKLCPFEKASQSSKSGGSEVSLGTWGEWSGSPNKYSEMKFTNGLGCWNGPNRSTTVKLSCGISNELTGASEPNKCEYEFVFKTPAACHPDSHVHDEF